jgi:hypothetical protein
MLPTIMSPTEDKSHEKLNNIYFTVTDEKDRTELCNGIKRRSTRRQSETTLCERDNEMRPALLNNIGDRQVL